MGDLLVSSLLSLLCTFCVSVLALSLPSWAPEEVSHPLCPQLLQGNTSTYHIQWMRKHGKAPDLGPGPARVFLRRRFHSLVFPEVGQ